MAREKRLFVAFAIEDRQYRDFLKGQAQNTSSPFSYTDMSAKQPWDSQWKTNCRTRIRGCDGTIAIITPNTYNADGARWEIKTTIEEGKPILGLYAQRNNPGTVPPELSGRRVIYWDQAEIARFIDSL